MTPARTVFVFGLYLVLIGLGLLVAPNATLGPLGFPPSVEVWPRIVGLLALCLACYYIAAARAGLTHFFGWTVAVRGQGDGVRPLFVGSVSAVGPSECAERNLPTPADCR